MCWFVVVQHEVEDIALRGNEDDLQSGIPGGGCEGPEEVYAETSVVGSSNLLAVAEILLVRQWAGSTDQDIS